MTLGERFAAVIAMDASRVSDPVWKLEERGEIWHHDVMIHTSWSMSDEAKLACQLLTTTVFGIVRLHYKPIAIKG